MRIARPAFLMAVICGLVASAAAPAVAISAPTPSITPTVIRAGQSITATVTDCDPPEGGGGIIESDLLSAGRGDLDAVPGQPGTWRGTFPTNPDAMPRPYKIFFRCSEEQIFPTLTVTVVGPAPKFTAEFTPHTFFPGDRLTLTTSGCHTLPRVADMDHMFTAHLDLHPIGVTRHRGSAVTRKSISPELRYIVIVNCQTLSDVTFTLVPGKKITKHRGGRTGSRTGDQTSVVPVGGIDTGDGSSLSGGSAPVGPVAVALAGGTAGLVLVTGSWLAYRRRTRSRNA